MKRAEPNRLCQTPCITLLLVGLIVLLGSDVHAQEPVAAEAPPTQAEINQQLLIELQAIREQLKQINEKLDEQAEEQANNGAKHQAFDGFVRQGPNHKALKKIKLPENPTREDMRTYIEEIIQISRRQNSFSSDDLQVRMLTELGPENLDLLLEYTGRGRGNFHVGYAIKLLVQRDHKDLVLENLDTHKDLVEFVVQFGWEEEARKTLVHGLENHTGHVPTQWVTAVASFEEPALYPALKRYLENGSNRSWTYESIRFLPGIELDASVKKAWRRVRFESSWDASQFAPIACAHGEISALEYLIDQINPDNQDANNPMPGMFGMDGRIKLRHTVLEAIEFRGSNKEIVEWFEKHQNELKFDHDKKKFVVKDEEADWS